MLKNYAQIIVRNVDLKPGMWRNFSGEKRQFNPAGSRTFCAFMDPDVARELEAEGWPVRWTKPRDEDGEPEAYFQIKFNYDFDPKPEICKVLGDIKTYLDEETVGQLDRDEIDHADIKIKARHYKMLDGKEGYTLYLMKLSAYMIDDDF